MKTFEFDLDPKYHSVLPTGDIVFYDNEFSKELMAQKKNHIEKTKLVFNDIIEKALRETAVPPIKGEITKGKIQWRGIRLCQRMDTLEQWVEQRGVRISPIMKLTINVNYE